MKYRIALYMLILITLLAGCGSFIFGDRVDISCLVNDETGNIYAAWRLVRSVGDHDVFLTKISRTGEVLWDKALLIGDDRRVNIMGLVSDEKGGVYVGWDMLAPENDKEGRHYFEKHTLVNVDGQGNLTMSRDFSLRGMQMASDGHGGILLCRLSRENAMIERVDEQGNTLWEYRLEIGDVYRQFMAGKDGESFILLRNWDDSYVTIRKVGPNGQAAWGKEGITVDIPQFDTYGEQNPLMSSDNTGGVVVSWEIRISDEMRSTMGAFRINAGGELVYNETLRSSVIPSGHMKAFPGDSGGSIIVWEGHRPGIALYAQKVNDKGESLWRENGAAVCTELPSVSPRFDAVSDGEGGAIVAWIDGRYRLSVQRLDTSGQRLWGDEGMKIASGVSESQILISGDRQHGITIGWSTDKDSYIQMIDTNGVLLWENSGIKLSD